MLDGIKKKLINMLLSVSESTSFPFDTILKQQINASQITCATAQYTHTVHFRPSQDVRQFPSWLDTVPVSWQICIDNVPVTCELFISNGYIEDLEIVDMGFERIKWEHLFDTSPRVDFEYNEQYVYDYLSSEPLILEKVRNDSQNVDFMLNHGSKSTVASFRKCQIRRLNIPQFPVQVIFEIREACDEKYRYTIQSSDANIDFDCALLFLKLHTIIG